MIASAAILVPLPAPLPPGLGARIASWLGLACARTGCEFTVAELLEMCADGEAQLVAVCGAAGPVAAGVTQVRRHADGRRTCWVLALGGVAFGPWSAVIAAIERGAARLGCTSVEFVGRRGWARVLPGYTATPCEVGFYFEKTLEARR